MWCLTSHVRHLTPHQTPSTSAMNPNRRNWLKFIGFGLAGIGLARINVFAEKRPSNPGKGPSDRDISSNPAQPQLGAFSISLAVKDLIVSKEFYEKLGFTVFAGDKDKNYLIMKNGNALIGLFQGMFEKNILTFNPGWDENAQQVKGFEDIRKIQRRLKEKGMKFLSEADENGSGPASFIMMDPDGNTILLDQHI